MIGYTYTHPGDRIPIKQIAESSTGPYLETTSPTNIIPVFKATEIPIKSIFDPSLKIFSFICKRETGYYYFCKIIFSMN
jgi:hypothetical protein